MLVLAPPTRLQPHSIDLNPAPPHLISVSVVIFQFEETALHKAADKGDVECLKVLLDKGSDVNATKSVCD